MSDDVKLTYKRVGELYSAALEEPGQMRLAMEGVTFAILMMQAHRALTNNPDAGLMLLRTDRPGLLPAMLEPRLLELLRNDPVSYIRANSPPPRVIDMRDQGKRDRTSALAAGERYDMPKTGGLRHGLDTLADAFGEALYAKGKQSGDRWLFEHPATGRWADLNTIEHWLGSHDTVVQPIDDKHGWLIIKTQLLLATGAERFYYPREWNEFGSWITKEQLQVKLEQFGKDKTNVARK